MSLMNLKPVLILLLVLSCAAITAAAADWKDYSRQDIDQMWPELWKSLPGVKIPTIDPLSESQAIRQLAGNWNTWTGPYRERISLETNGQVSVSGVADGKKWEKHGEWKVISNKVVFLLPDVEIPNYIFLIKGEPYAFNPGVDSLMSEMQRPTVSTPPLTNNAQQLQPVIAVNGKISKAQVLDILRSMDEDLLAKETAALIAHFASNAVISATVVEGSRTDTTTNDPDSYRRDIEAGYKDFDDCKIQRKDISVHIAPNGRTATTESTVLERYEFQGSAQHANTTESDTFEVIDGKILITEMHSKVIVK